jgi:hypothetical protein
MVERVIEERPTTEPVVIHERDHDHVRDTSGSNTGAIIAVVVVLLLLLVLIFGRGMFSSGSSTPDVNVTPSTSSGSQ